LSLDRLRTGSDIFYLGCGGSGFSVKQVIETARNVTGQEIPVHFAPRRPGDPAILCASSERIQRILGWRPSRDNLYDIISSAWNWFQFRQEAAADPQFQMTHDVSNHLTQLHTLILEKDNDLRH
jgi:UDP-glucose 4-epimerase